MGTHAIELKRRLFGEGEQPATLLVKALLRIRTALEIDDIGVCPRKKQIYLLDTPKKLENLLVNSRHTEIRILGAGTGKINSHLSEHLRQAGRWPHRGRGTWIETPTYWGALDRAVLVLAGIDDPDIQESEEWSVYEVPYPGSPQCRWWSLKKKAWVPRVRPPRFSLCDGAPVPFGRADGPVLIQSASKKTPPLFLSHGISLEDLRRVEKCGGMLWPSWALTWKVPVAYGDLVFLADTRILFDRLKPTGRSTRKIGLFPSDIWSWATGTLHQYEKAVNYELSANEAWWNGEIDHNDGGWGLRVVKDKLLSSGRTSSDITGAFAPEIADREIRTMNQLFNRIRSLIKTYSELDPDPYTYLTSDEHTEIDLAHPEQGMKYPYLELKVAGIVHISDLPAVLFPRRNHRSVNAFLDRMKFTGWRIPVTWGGHRREGGLELGMEIWEEGRRKWASTMTRSLLEWARRPCGTAGIAVPPSVQGNWKASYNPLARYIPKGTSEWYEWGRSLGWKEGRCSAD